MKETNFIDQNKKKWKELEEELQEKRKDPDKLSNLFIQVTDDLSYARTFYPNRFVRLYLNNIAQQLFYSIYKNKRVSKNSFVKFWREELPDLVYSARKELTFSLIFFLIAVGIGIFSCRHDPGFANLILGDGYVSTTIDNIKKGDPLAVYKQSNSLDMFLGISLNNLKVSFLVYITGILYCVGSLGMLLFNGIMVGVFQYFFIKYGLFQESFLTIWLHGTLEISCIIIAGGAGITLGKGLVFPGTYNRAQSFFISARKSIKILIGIAPIIVLAAIIESYMTRYTHAPDAVRLGIILFSATFIFLYFVVYPIRRHRNGLSSKIPEANLQAENDEPFNYNSIQPLGSIYMEVFNIYKLNGGKFLRWAFLMALAASITALLFTTNYFRSYGGTFNLLTLTKIISHHNQALFFINVLSLATLLFLQLRLASKHVIADFKITWRSFAIPLLISLLINFSFLLPNILPTICGLIIGPMMALWLATGFFIGGNFINSFKKNINYYRIATGKVNKTYFTVGLTCLLLLLILQTPLMGLYISIAQWNVYLTPKEANLLNTVLTLFSAYFSLFIIMPFFVLANFLSFFSVHEIATASELKRKIHSLKTDDKKREKL